MKSLKAQHSELSYSENQLRLLNGVEGHTGKFTPFSERLKETGLFPLRPSGIQIFQMNLGKMCNQVCKHCHVDAGPDRKEIMTQETMLQCLEALDGTDVPIVDLTGGAPELNPNFRWFVESLSDLGKHIIDRCNLTIILANKKYHGLPDFFAMHKIEVVASLPYYSKRRTDGQRGNGVFEKSIQALKMLNEAGYGKEGTGLKLNLVFNPSGAFLPPDQKELEKDFKKELKLHFGIEFNNLLVITNLPISRFLDYLIASENYDEYMEKLVNAYNPAAAMNVMCRDTISIGWDGFLYDCDFNQMLDLKVENQVPQHIQDFDLAALNNRNIILNQHCYGCTAGSGSSCGGATT
ncbi:MAG: arsenosugar biosynthesis radical SAM (seleno)protein ArsS [Bacteroidia bacterium]